MSARRVFDLDALPFHFPDVVVDTRNSESRATLLTSVNGLAKSIWESSPHKFCHDNKGNGSKFSFYCCQDEHRNKKKRSASQRDRETTTRFECESALLLKVDLGRRLVKVEFEHKLHCPYIDKHLSAEVKEFAAERLLSHTPAEVYEQIRRNNIKGWESVAEYQIYYLWKDANAAAWRCHVDPVRSAYLLLDKFQGSYRAWEGQFGNVHGLAIYISSTIEALATVTVEMAMDETYGTNSAGMGLFVVLAEVDGCGIPLAYLLVETEKNKDGKKKADQGAIIQILQEFLAPLKASGFNPMFFGTDKDQSEISAIELTWPHPTKVQLCMWHAKRAIQSAMMNSDKTATQSKYHPNEAQKVLPELEICWGSTLLRRPDEDHRRERCKCSSKKREAAFAARGRLEVRTKEERAAVLNMFLIHYNKHHSFPNTEGRFDSPDMIYRECVREMYHWCRKRDYFRLWAYMWINWYRPARWRLWARSASEQVSVLRTTMIVESHWRKIKHDYLHRFNRPRIDLVTWVLCTRVIPDSIHLLRALTDPKAPQSRFTEASWRKKWKAEYTRLEDKAVEVKPEKIMHYHTDPRLFVCSCPAFLVSRFLLCKHIVRCHRPANREQRALMKRLVQRNRVAPFWSVPQLRIHDRFLHLFPPIQNDPSHQIPSATISLPIRQIHDYPLNESDSETEEGPETLGIEEQLMQLLAIVKEKHQEGNTRFLKSLAATHRLGKVGELVQEVKELRQQKTCPKTWRTYKHPSMIFYNK